MRKVINIQVEKGEQQYRPDVKLVLDSGETIECEVVYKNPLRDKLETYKTKQANLLVWKVGGVVNEVPPLVQYSWYKAEEKGFFNSKDLSANYLRLIASPHIQNHVCGPYGIAYVFDSDCWKCNQKTRLALISSWYPVWGSIRKREPGAISQADDHFSFYTNIPVNAFPRQFLEKLNKQYHTHISNDYSNTMSESYLMNHCGKCGAKVGDFYLPTMFAESSGVDRIMVDFELTKWENKATHNSA